MRLYYLSFNSSIDYKNNTLSFHKYTLKSFQHSFYIKYLFGNFKIYYAQTILNDKTIKNIK
jgi:hypothetical protein